VGGSGFGFGSGSRDSLRKKSEDARTSTLISLGLHIDTEAAPMPPLPPTSPPPLRPKKSTKRILVQPAPSALQVQNIYDVPRFEIKTESFYSQYEGGYHN
jgi:hypothetical protein